MAYSDDEILRIVGDERKRSLGFGEGDTGDLTTRRADGLAYARGDMVNVSSPNKLPAPEGRSGVTDSTVSDAIETLLPDVIEVFVGGDDTATFIPNGPEDEQQAQDETDLVSHVLFVENNGYLILLTAFKDALESITGVIYWYSEEEDYSDPVGVVPPELADQAQAVAASQDGEIETEEQEDGSVAISRPGKRLKVCVKAVPSEDFTVASDTVLLAETTYCAMRMRPRVQDLIKQGVDAEKARALKPYNQRNDTVEQARDEAGEHQLPQDGGIGDLRIVEVRAHYIRLLDGDDLKLYRVLTDADEAVLLEKDECDHIPFAAGSPYIIPHRFYGEGVPDKTIEIQKIKTVFLRSLMDSIYFALNQRNEVSEADSSENTIADLLRNAPGVPVRSKTGNAIKPIQAPALNVPLLEALEYASTMAEGRTGIVRNAQGLNPDTLHDTAQGALALIGAAQKRVRLVARNFAETIIRDLYVGIHRTLRTSYSGDYKKPTAKIGKAWKNFDPANWPERNAMAIHVGVGSAGKEHDLAIAGKRLEIAGQVTAEGGMGTVFDPKNAYNQLLAFERAAGTKAPEKYWTDPATVPPKPPQPSPEMAKAQADIQLRQVQAKSDMDLAQSKAQTDAALQAQKHQNDMQASEAQAQRDHQLKLAQVESDGALKRYQIDQELQLKREQSLAEITLKREEMQLNAQIRQQTESAKIDQANVGGQPG